MCKELTARLEAERNAYVRLYEAAEAAKHRVYELHTKEKHGVRWHCGECLQDDNTGGWEYVEYPCPTVRALEPR